VWCKKLWYSIKNKKARQNSRINFSPNKKKKIVKLQETKDIVKRNYLRATIKINTMYETLNTIKEEMVEISNKNLSQILENSNVPNCQKDLIFEIFKASKVVNSKNRKYSENWILLCLLFQLR